MTAKERNQLLGYVSWSIRCARVALYLMAVGFVGWCLWSIHGTFLKSNAYFAWDVWWLFPTVATAVWLARKGKTWTGGRQGVNDIQADLADGNMAVHRIQAADVIEIEEAEDEGPSFFVLTTERKIILFHGQEMTGWKRKGFPWGEFDIMETPRSKMLFRLKRRSAPFPPSFVRKPLSYEDAKKFSGNFKGSWRIVDVDFESLKRDPAKR